MSSLFGLAEQVISAASSGHSDSQSGQTVSTTGGPQYNSPHHSQQSQGRFDTQAVLSHAGDVHEEDKGFIANAIQHVHDNPQQHQQQVSEGDLTKYAPMIFKVLQQKAGSMTLAHLVEQALSSVTTKSGGGDIGSLIKGGLGEGGGNQLMGLVLKQVGSTVSGSSGQEKQSLMNGAAMTLTKLVAQKQLSAFTGGSNSGGLGMLSNLGKSLLENRSG